MTPHSQYLCFTPSTDITVAVKRFVEWFSAAPKRCYVSDRLLWVGPIDPDEESKDEHAPDVNV